MAQYTSENGAVWNIPDGQPDFPTWCNANPERQAQWEAAAKAYFEYNMQHGTKPTDSACDGFFHQWISEVKPQRVS